MGDPASVTKLAAWLGRALGASADLFDAFDTDEFGVQLPDAVLSAAPVQAALGHAVSAAGVLDAAAAKLESADGQQIATFIEFGTAARAYFDAVANLASSVGAAITASSVPDADHRSAATAVAEELAMLVADAVIADAIMFTAPQLMFVLKLLGLADWRYVVGDDTTPGHVRRRLHLERLKGLFTDPASHLRDALGWGTDSFDPSDFFAAYRQYFIGPRSIHYGADAQGPFLIQDDITTRRSAHTPPGLSITWQRDYEISEDASVDISDTWSAQLSGKAAIVARASAEIQPPLDISISAPVEVSGDVKLFAGRIDGAPPIDVLQSDLISIQVAKAAIGVGATAKWQPTNGTASAEVMPFATLTGVTIRLGTADADSFIGELLGGLNIAGTVDLALEWTAAHGLRVRASGGLEIRLPVHKSLGFATLDSLYLAQRVSDDGNLRWEVSAALSGTFGPLTAVVDRLGMTVDLHMRDDTGGQFGRFDLALGFKPPTGAGLAVDAAVVRGGGYVSYDPDNAEYAGVLELALLDYVTVKAIGLITTRMPDGSKGFSLLLILTAEFGTGIQLGFGFTLLGVGGLIGLNRSMRLDALLAGVRSGAIQSVMFPTNVVANAPRIISDLRAFFPPTRGVFLIGPMAKLGWGTPPLITLSVGVIIEIPGNVAILGVLKVVLPDEKNTVIRLQADFVGAIEFGAKRAWLYAVLVDSRILETTVDGELGVLVSWGDPANFVVSVGGFHPQFQPPPLPFPVPARIATTILDADYGHITIAGYVAVTSNTVQFGAQAQLTLGIRSANIDGHLSFDALFHFSPFSFVIDIAAQMSVKLFGIGLFSVSVHFTLAGPTPWRATGYGEISLLFFSKKVHFDITWGEQIDTSLPAIAVLALLVDEYSKVANWRAIGPTGSAARVTLSSNATGLVVHPLGQLAVSQRAVPLGVHLDKVGGRPVADANRFTVEFVGVDLAKSGDVTESFAIGQFTALDDAAALNAQAFQHLPSGAVAGPSAGDYRSGNATVRTVRYESVILDVQPEPETTTHVEYPGRLFAHFLSGNATARSDASMHRRTQLVPVNDRVAVQAETFVIANVADSKAFNATEFASAAEAAAFLADLGTRQPSTADGLHVIPAYERVSAP